MNNTNATHLVNALASAVALVIDVCVRGVPCYAGSPVYVRRSASMPSRRDMHHVMLATMVATGLPRSAGDPSPSADTLSRAAALVDFHAAA